MGSEHSEVDLYGNDNDSLAEIVELRPERRAAASFDDYETLRASFDIEGTSVDALLIPDKEKDYVVGVTIDQHLDEHGEPKRKYLRLPKRIRELGHTTVEFYESHEKLVKGIGAVTIGGFVTLGSIKVFKAFKRG
jgi:hypothetical protein